MRFTGAIARNRPLVILLVLCMLSLVSMATGTQGTVVHRGVLRGAAVAAYPFLKLQDLASRGADYVLDYFVGYNELRARDTVAREVETKLNAAMGSLWEARQENERLREMLAYQRGNPRLTLVPARVLASARGTLTIDRGALHGVREAMGVITPEGVVGMITETGRLAATVATLHHPRCNVGAMVMRNRVRAYDGVIKASKSDLSVLCTLEYIDVNDDVRVGDMVSTSPESIFPPNLPIGRITRVHHSETLWRYADVRPAVDPYSVDEVFVVQRASLGPDVLTGAHQPAVAPSSATGAEMPDLRTLQDRLAP